MITRQRVFIITLTAFLMNVMLPFFAVYDSYTKAETFFGDKIPICTANGFKWVSAGDLQNNKNLPKHDNEYKCPLCYVSANGINQIVPESVSNIEYKTAVNLLSYDLSNQVTRIYSLNSSKLSRAPPFSIIL